MESDMVNSNNEVIKNYFQNNLPLFRIVSENTYSMHWYIKYCKDNIAIEISGDLGGFSIIVIIDESKYPLWQYDRRVNNAMETSNENILFQLVILKKFLLDISE